VRLPRQFGAEPVFPKGQTCCGQPAFNVGYEAQARAAVTVGEVIGAIAETGTLVCSSEGDRAVRAGVLPAHEPDPDQGPGRTADIEPTLAIGVHGPGGSISSRPRRFSRPPDRQVGDIGARRPVTTRSPSAGRRGRRRCSPGARRGRAKGRGARDGGSVGVRPRGVGGSVDPSVPAASTAIAPSPASSNAAARANSWFRPPLPLPSTFTVVSPPAIIATACPGESASAAFRNRAQNERAHSLASPRRNPAGGRSRWGPGPTPVPSAAPPVHRRPVRSDEHRGRPEEGGSSCFGVSGRAPSAPSVRCRRTGEGTA